MLTNRQLLLRRYYKPEVFLLSNNNLHIEAHSGSWKCILVQNETVLAKPCHKSRILAQALVALSVPICRFLFNICFQLIRTGILHVANGFRAWYHYLKLPNVYESHRPVSSAATWLQQRLTWQSQYPPSSDLSCPPFLHLPS